MIAGDLPVIPGNVPVIAGDLPVIAGFLHSPANISQVAVLNVRFLSLRMMMVVMMWTQRSNSSYCIRLSATPN